MPAVAGLDIGRVIDTISKGAAQSWQMDNRWQTMIDGKFEFGFAVDWVRKDFAHLLRGGAAERRRAARDGAGRSVLRRDPGDGRRPVGHLQPDRAARPQRVKSSNTDREQHDRNHHRRQSHCRALEPIHCRRRQAPRRRARRRAGAGRGAGRATIRRAKSMCAARPPRPPPSTCARPFTSCRRRRPKPSCWSWSSV